MLLACCCIVCLEPGPAICATCAGKFRAASPFPQLPGFDSCSALVDYTGAARDAIVRLKYRNARRVLALFGCALAELIAASPSTRSTRSTRSHTPHADVVTWAPTSKQRRRDRGFDQAELLARAVARHLGLPCRSLLARTNGPHQTGLTLAERLDGPSFRARGQVRGSVLLVDDVITTGATMIAAAGALRAAGASAVHGVAAAHTPLITAPAAPVEPPLTMCESPSSVLKVSPASSEKEK